MNFMHSLYIRAVFTNYTSDNIACEHINYTTPTSNKNPISVYITCLQDFIFYVFLQYYCNTILNYRPKLHFLLYYLLSSSSLSFFFLNLPKKSTVFFAPIISPIIGAFKAVLYASWWTFLLIGSVAFLV